MCSPWLPGSRKMKVGCNGLPPFIYLLPSAHRGYHAEQGGHLCSITHPELCFCGTLFPAALTTMINPHIKQRPGDRAEDEGRCLALVTGAGTGLSQLRHDVRSRLRRPSVARRLRSAGHPGPMC